MAWYKIYAGLGGGFGGAEYKGTFEYKSEADAEADALIMQLMIMNHMLDITVFLIGKSVSKTVLMLVGAMMIIL